MVFQVFLDSSPRIKGYRTLAVATTDVVSTQPGVMQTTSSECTPSEVEQGVWDIVRGPSLVAGAEGRSYPPPEGLHRSIGDKAAIVLIDEAGKPGLAKLNH